MVGWKKATTGRATTNLRFFCVDVGHLDTEGAGRYEQVMRGVVPTAFVQKAAVQWEADSSN